MYVYIYIVIRRNIFIIYNAKERSDLRGCCCTHC